jgi:PmbA protein
MNGFSGEYETTAFRLSVSAIAMDNGSMQRDGWFSENRRLSLLERPEEIGAKAAERAVRRLRARKVKTREAPVVFDRDTASSLLRHLSSACSGHSIFLGASFLVDRLGTRIAPGNFMILDDASLPGALGSRPFDAEGVCTRKTAVVEEGILSNYLLDTYSARRLGLQTTGSAFRRPGDPPVAGPSNFYLLPGSWDPQEIISTVKSGFFVTELMGFGFNPVTGDYSRGAGGLWIENGELSFPVEEVTIAGNLKEMLLNVEMIGNDLKLRSRVSSPTLKISRMMIAGE